MSAYISCILNSNVLKCMVLSPVPHFVYQVATVKDILNIVLLLSRKQV